MVALSLLIAADILEHGRVCTISAPSPRDIRCRAEGPLIRGEDFEDTKKHR